ncbi:MAG: hypothetical protein WC612_05520 [Bdellovibrionales bacterium]
MNKSLVLLIALIGLCASGSVEASSYRRSPDDVYVNGYSRQDGTYVEPHYRSAPDGNPYNNYGRGD